MSGPIHYKNKFVRWINRNNIKVGDKVQIHALYPTSDKCILNRFNEALLNYWGRNNYWLKNVIKFSKMYNKQVATIVEINYDNSRSNIILDIVDGVPWPFYCLQKVKDTDIINTNEKTKEINTMSKHTFKRDDIVLIRKNDPDSKWIKARYVHMVDNDTKHVCNFIYNEFITDLNLFVEIGKDFIVPYIDQTRFLEGTKESYSWMEFLKSKQLVLVTNELDNKDIWLIASFGGILTSGYKGPEFGVYDTNNSRKYYNYCIPYEGNEHKRNKVAKKEDLIYDYQ